MPGTAGGDAGTARDAMRCREGPGHGRRNHDGIITKGPRRMEDTPRGVPRHALRPSEADSQHHPGAPAPAMGLLHFWTSKGITPELAPVPSEITS